MQAILHNATNMPLILPTNEALRNLRPRKTNPTGAKHSPDGYFAHDELVRTWRPFAAHDAGNIRSRSRTANAALSHADPSIVLQDVVEEEDMSDPHSWRPPSKTDSRGPCPALGALSNHGYLPRDGRNIGVWQMVQAIREGYGGSLAYALALTIVSYIIMRLGGVGKGWLRPTIDLEDLGAHGVLEHDGSLTHADIGEDEPTTPQDRLRPRSPASSTSSSSTTIPVTKTPASFPVAVATALSSLILRAFFTIASRLPLVSRFFRPRTHVYARTRPSRRLINELFADSASGTHLTLADVARARVRRDASTRPIPSRIIKQFAAGEFAMTIDILGHDGRVELGVLRAWLEDERLPRGWAPSHVQGLWRTHVVTGKVQALMQGLREYRRKGRNVRSVVHE